MKGFARMAENSDYFRRRAAEARYAASHEEEGENAEVAGYLALAYAALARRRKAAPAADTPDAVDPAVASVSDDIPLMLRD